VSTQQRGGTQDHPSPQASADAAHPQRRKQPAKRQAIIDAAQRVFLAQGFAGSSVDAIAAAAGVSKQTIYNHFGDKEALFRAVVRAVQSDFSGDFHEAGLGERLATSDDLRRDLRELGRRWVAVVLQEDVAALRRLVIAEQDRHPWLFDEWQQPRPVLERTLRAAISKQAERGALDVADVGLAVDQLLLVVITGALTRAAYGRRDLTEAEAGQIVDNGVEMWLRCYRAATGQSGRRHSRACS
jgi:TetR/AcrR family transcriptional regulator, mexJK operon transcriptional repressor